MAFFNFFSKNKSAQDEQEQKQVLADGLEKTRSSIFSKLSKAVLGKSTVDEELLDELEMTLIAADLGVETTAKVIARIEARIARDKYRSEERRVGKEC